METPPLFPSHIMIINSISFFQLENLIFILIEVTSFVIEQMQGVVPMNGDATCTKDATYIIMYQNESPVSVFSMTYVLSQKF